MDRHPHTSHGCQQHRPPATWRLTWEGPARNHGSLRAPNRPGEPARGLLADEDISVGHVLHRSRRTARAARSRWHGASVLGAEERWRKVAALGQPGTSATSRQRVDRCLRAGAVGKGQKEVKSLAWRQLKPTVLAWETQTGDAGGSLASQNSKRLSQAPALARGASSILSAGGPTARPRRSPYGQRIAAIPWSPWSDNRPPLPVRSVLHSHERSATSSFVAPVIRASASAWRTARAAAPRPDPRRRRSSSLARDQAAAGGVPDRQRSEPPRGRVRRLLRVGRWRKQSSHRMALVQRQRGHLGHRSARSQQAPDARLWRAGGKSALLIRALV
jgi:hypothetical protein